MPYLNFPGSVLHDTALRRWGRGSITPYSDEMVNPASYDLRLGSQLRVPMWYWRWPLRRAMFMLHKANPNKYPLWGQPKQFDTYIMMPGDFILCTSLETTTIPDDAVAQLLSKSSIGRVGLEHLHAGYGDPGFSGQWTWELLNVAPWPIELVVGKRIMQLVLMCLVDVPAATYEKTGRYQNQIGPQPAKEKAKC